MRSSLLLLLGVLAAAAAEGSPWYCHDLECPSFKSLRNLTLGGQDIELRHYPAAKWASTVVTGVKYDKAVAKGFWALFKYISGNNEPETKIEMTAPVTVRVTPSQGPFCEDNFTISFFVPFQFQDAPPKPSDEAVFIESRPPLTVFAKSFSGWATGATYVSQAADVTQALDDAGEAIDASMYYTAGYDSPFRLLNRHNEVWIPAASKPTTDKVAWRQRQRGAVAAA